LRVCVVGAGSQPDVAGAGIAEPIGSVAVARTDPHDQRRWVGGVTKFAHLDEGKVGLFRIENDSVEMCRLVLGCGSEVGLPDNVNEGCITDDIRSESFPASYP